MNGDITFEEFLKLTMNKRGFTIRPKIICVDGFEISAQGSDGHYCKPRSNQDWYVEMEVGYPSEKEDDLLPYAEDPELPTQTVYGYVPVSIIKDIIDKHGGIDVASTLFTPRGNAFLE